MPAEVVAADFEEAGDEDVFRKVSGDLKAKGIAIDEAVIRQKMATLVGLSPTSRSPPKVIVPEID